MFSLRHFLIAMGLSGTACGVVMIFSRCENPRELVLGDWKGSNNPLQAEVTESTVSWSAPGARGRLSYTWLQEKNSPYRVNFRRGQTVVEADVRFDGKNTVIVEPCVFQQLPPMLQEHLRSRNKSLGRPEEELKLIFRRLRREDN